MSHRRIALYFDPPSHHFLGDRLFDCRFAVHGGDQLLAPYSHLREFLTARGIIVHTSDYYPSRPDGTRIIYVSAGSLSNYKRFANRPDTVLSAFFAMECPTVEPGMYRELNRAQHFFKRIFSWSDSSSLEPFVGGPLRCQKLYWPQSYESVHEEIWQRGDRYFLTMINANKFPRYRSAVRELYSERLKALEYFSRTGDIILYGVGWDRPTMLVGRACLPGTFGRVPMPGAVQRIRERARWFWDRLCPDPRLAAARRVYRGVAASKAEVLGRHKFAICFENSVLKGWITEKIFDCFFAGTVPVYWGAPDIEDYVPKECFIDMRIFRSYAELGGHLHSLTERDIQEYKASARAFLASPRFQPFTKHAFAELFARMIEEDTAVSLNAVQRTHV